ncbi:MAG: hypothetical protein Q8Q03_02295 [bacterium]|nr:hypothetical protein [bacterium]
MKKIISTAVIALLVMMGVSQGVSAQTYTPSPNAPVLYNQSGQVVNGFNTSTGGLNAGTYYTAQGNERYYFPNGTYYDPATQQYGGNIIYPNVPGPAGVVVNPGTGTGGTGGGVFTPGVPDTGAGGGALLTWISLLASGLIVATGVTYILRRRTSLSS